METPEDIAKQFLDLWAEEMNILLQDPVEMQRFLFSIASRMAENAKGQG